MELFVRISGREDLEQDYAALSDRVGLLTYKGPYDAVVLQGMKAFLDTFVKVRHKGREVSYEDSPVLDLEFHNFPEELYDSDYQARLSRITTVRHYLVLTLRELDDEDPIVLAFRTIMARLIGDQIVRRLSDVPEGEIIDSAGVYQIRDAFIGSRVGDECSALIEVSGDVHLSPEKERDLLKSSLIKAIRKAVAPYTDPPTIRFERSTMEVTF